MYLCTATQAHNLYHPIATSTRRERGSGQTLVSIYALEIIEGHSGEVSPTVAKRL